MLISLIVAIHIYLLKNGPVRSRGWTGLHYLLLCYVDSCTRKIRTDSACELIGPIVGLVMLLFEVRPYTAYRRDEGYMKRCYIHKMQLDEVHVRLPYNE